MHYTGSKYNLPTKNIKTIVNAEESEIGTLKLEVSQGNTTQCPI